MTASQMMEDPMPPTPIQLKFCITEDSRVNMIVERVVNSHSQVCPRRQNTAVECSDRLCQYFTWHLNHHTSHRQFVQDCEHCIRFESWIEKHSTICRSRCDLSLCDELKKRSVKDRIQQFMSPTSSLGQMGDVPYNRTTSYGEVTPDSYIDDTKSGYDSGTPSSHDSPSCSGSDISGGESEEEKERHGDTVQMIRSHPHPSLPLMSLRPASGSYPSRTHQPAHPDWQPHTCKKKQQRESSDSAFSSTSENEDMSSIESDCITPAGSTPACTLESVSTPSTVHIPSFGNSGSSGMTSLPMDPHETNEAVLPTVEEQFKITDELLEKYSDDLTMLDNWGRPIFTDNPSSPASVATHDCAYFDQDWRESYAVPSLGHQTSSHEQYQQPPMSYTEDEVTIKKSIDHRASVREYLQGQFYMRQTYRERVHWNRVEQIGHGGQAKCYSIEDNANKYLLCLKEETENKKTLDETFICLKLAMLVREAPQNIVEFFGASILPHPSGNNHLQLFLELMPGCLQGHIFKNGPLSPEATLNYSYQLFEALDYLHQRLKVIHCDIKPANLLIDYNCQRLKVADFGCAELLEECCHGKGFPENKDAGTLWYNPPEFYWTGNCSFGMDMWQAGCSVLYMITGRRPWRHLCMDVNKSSPRATHSQSALAKKKYCQLIGDQRGNYPLPGFLTNGVWQLLSGCLQSQGRLSAKDCVYLAAVSEATNHEQKSNIVAKLGYTPGHDVLERLQASVCTQTTVDVYLGKEMFSTELDGVPHAMLNGWLGSLSYQNSMTYGDLLNLARQQIPVTQFFGSDCGLAISDNNPQAIWKSVGTGKPYRVRPDQPVDPARAFILLPKERTFV